MTIRHPEHGFTPTGTREDEFTWKPLRLLTFYRLILAGLLTTDTRTRLVVRDPAGSGDGLVGVGAVGEAGDKR